MQYGFLFPIRPAAPAAAPASWPARTGATCRRPGELDACDHGRKRGEARPVRGPADLPLLPLRPAGVPYRLSHRRHRQTDRGRDCDHRWRTLFWALRVAASAARPAPIAPAVCQWGKGGNAQVHLCLERWAGIRNPSASWPARCGPLDAGPLEEMRAKYGGHPGGGRIPPCRELGTLHHFQAQTGPGGLPRQKEPLLDDTAPADGG